MTYPVYVSNQTFRDCMDLLLISDENKSHYVYIKDFDRFICNKTKNKNEKYFCKCCLQCFGGEKVLIEHKENCLIVNGIQSLKLKSDLKIISNNYSFLLKFMLILNAFWKELGVDIKTMAHTQKNIKITFLAVLLTKLCVLIINLVKRLFLTDKKNAVYKFIKAIIVFKCRTKWVRKIHGFDN